MRAKRLAAVAAAASATRRLQAVRRTWDELLGATTVKTPDPLFDAMVNRWLLYQTVACRLWAKAGFYQAGGAFGFRDQLQDAMALAWAAPQMLRAQIVLAASRQFAEGDVQHWWHAPQRRRRAHPFLRRPAVAAARLRALPARHRRRSAARRVRSLHRRGRHSRGRRGRVLHAAASAPTTASVYEHAARAIDRSLRVGAHGLPLMGTGDWNDGMNRVGHEGPRRIGVARLVPVPARGRLRAAGARSAATKRARSAGRARAQGWKAALQGPAWDGQWFKRAFFDDGAPLGSQANPEAAST